MTAPLRREPRDSAHAEGEKGQRGRGAMELEWRWGEASFPSRIGEISST